MVEEGDRRSEALRASVNVAADAGEPYVSIPPVASWKRTPNAAYLHYTPNETIGGVEFHFVPDAGSVPLVADMSSTILSRPIDVAKFGLIYAGAQKNIGPAGLTLVIVRDDLLGRARTGHARVHGFRGDGEGRLDAEHAADVRVVHGGPRVPVAEAAGRPAGDGRAQPRQGREAVRGDRRLVVLSQPGREGRALVDERAVHARESRARQDFTAEAKQAGLVTLEGHRSVGGMRASLYNAMPMEGVNALVDFMQEFEKKHG